MAPPGAMATRRKGLRQFVSFLVLVVSLLLVICQVDMGPTWLPHSTAPPHHQPVPISGFQLALLPQVLVLVLADGFGVDMRVDSESRSPYTAFCLATPPTVLMLHQARLPNICMCVPPGERWSIVFEEASIHLTAETPFSTKVLEHCGPSHL